MKRTAFCSIAILCLSCTPGEQNGPERAGEVVFSDAPFLGEKAWNIGQGPHLTIGSDGERESGISLWRVRDALRLDDGRIVVAQANVNPLLILDPQGEFLRGMSREGEGPAEFRGIKSINVLSDGTIAAWGTVNRHLVLFDTLGRHRKTFSYRATVPELLISAHISTSMNLVAPKVSGPGAQPREGRRIEAPVQYLLFDTLGHRTILAEVPGYSMVGREREGRARWGRLLFGFISQCAEHAGRVVIGTTMDYEIQEFNLVPSPLLVRRIRWRPEEDRSVTQAHREDYLRLRASTSDDPAFQRSLTQLEDDDFNEVFPTHSRMRFGRDGFLWVRRYPRPGEVHGLWYVFDPAGRWATTVTLPADLELLDAGEDFLLGKIRTDLDVEQLHLYRLHKGMT